MPAKILLSLALALFLASPLAHAQSVKVSGVPQDALDAFAKEEPLTQADINTFIKIKTAGTPEEEAEIFTKSGWTKARAAYVEVKIGPAMSAVGGATLQMPDVIRPTKAELALVKENLPALNEAFGFRR